MTCLCPELSLFCLGLVQPLVLGCGEGFGVVASQGRGKGLAMAGVGAIGGCLLCALRVALCKDLQRRFLRDLGLLKGPQLPSDTPLHSAQTWMPGPGTSRQRNVPCVPASSASTRVATTGHTATLIFCLWTTACRACWASVWTCPRISRSTTTCGWSGRSSPDPSPGRSCCSDG